VARLSEPRRKRGADLHHHRIIGGVGIGIGFLDDREPVEGTER